MEIIIILGLILLNGIFSMAEMSLVSSRKFKLLNAKRKGSLGAKTALELSENPTKFLSTVQIGITLIGILLGVYSGEKLTNDVAGLLVQIDSIKPYSHTIAVAIVVICVTYFSIVLGELFPKRLGMTFPESIAIILAKPMRILSQITSPFVWLLTISNNLLVNLFGIKKTTYSNVSEEEIKAMIKESADGGEILEIEQNIVERVFELGDRKVNTLFTHRTNIVYFNVGDTWDDIREKINKDKHSAYPVCENNNIDQIKGMVLLKDLFTPEIEKDFHINKVIKQPIFINENTLAYKVLELFKKERIHYAIALDEYGTTGGMVTMDDVLDALLGDVSELQKNDYQITQRENNSWLVDGQYSVIEFVRYFDIKLEEGIVDKFSTVAGLILKHMSKLPNVGDKIIVDGYEIEIMDKDGQRIDKLMVTKI
jgi:putative hemolysin